MSEKLHPTAERQNEQIDVNEISRRNLERLQKLASTEANHDHNIDKIQASIHTEAISAKEVTVGEHRQDSHEPVIGMQRVLKDESYARSIRKIRSNLNGPERALNTLMHHKVVEPVSEFSAKTVARPSGVLGGGIVAFVGSGFVLYLARHYGFSYNFTTFLLLLACGFTAGIATELFFYFFRKKSY